MKSRSLRFGKITQRVTVATAPDKVFDAFIDPKIHAAFTNSPATCEPKVGGKFTASDGYIFGKNLELVKGKKIVQEWTTTEWPENYPPSILTLTFQAKRGGTLLTMIHARVPAQQTKQYSEGWKEYYWAPLKAYFSRPKKEAFQA